MQRGQLGLVPHRGAGRVRLEQLDGRGRAVGVGVGPGQRQPLAFGAGRVDALGTAVAGRADTADDRVDAVAVPLGVGKTLQRDHADALTDEGAVGGVVERPDTPAFGQGMGLAEAHVPEDRVFGVGATGDHHLGPAVNQLGHGHPDGRQRCRAGRVDRAVHPAQPHAVGNPTGDHVGQQPREGILLPRRERLDVFGGDGLGVGFGEPAAADHLLQDGGRQAGRQGVHQRDRPGNPQDHPRPRGVVPVGVRRTRVTQQIASHDQAQRLHDAGDLQLVRRKTELQRIEVDVGDEAAPARVGHVRDGRVRIEVVIEVPPARRDVLRAVRRIDDVLPVLPVVMGVREKTGHTDYRDRVVGQAPLRQLVAAHRLPLLSFVAAGDPDLFRALGPSAGGFFGSGVPRRRPLTFTSTRKNHDHEIFDQLCLSVTRGPGPPGSASGPRIR